MSGKTFERATYATTPDTKLIFLLPSTHEQPLATGSAQQRLQALRNQTSSSSLLTVSARPLPLQPRKYHIKKYNPASLAGPEAHDRAQDIKTVVECFDPLLFVMAGSGRSQDIIDGFKEAVGVLHDTEMLDSATKAVRMEPNKERLWKKVGAILRKQHAHLEKTCEPEDCKDGLYTEASQVITELIRVFFATTEQIHVYTAELVKLNNQYKSQAQGYRNANRELKRQLGRQGELSYRSAAHDQNQEEIQRLQAELKLEKEQKAQLERTFLKQTELLAQKEKALDEAVRQLSEKGRGRSWSKKRQQQRRKDTSDSEGVPPVPNVTHG